MAWIKIKHYLWHQVQFEFTLGSLFDSECHNLQFLQHHFKLHYEEFDLNLPKFLSVEECYIQSLHPTTFCLQYPLGQLTSGETAAGRAMVGFSLLL